MASKKEKPDKERMGLVAERIWRDAELRIMEDVVRRIKKAGEITSTADYQINRLIEMGRSREEVERIIKESLDATWPEMFEMYDKVAEWEYVRNQEVYEQITDGIRKMIITHAIPEGEKLPSVRELASKFAINPNAVRKAYQELEEEGYVCDREGERMAASEKQIAELIRKELLQEFDTVVIRLQNMSVGTEELTGRMWELAGGSKDFD